MMNGSEKAIQGLKVCLGSGSCPLCPYFDEDKASFQCKGELLEGVLSFVKLERGVPTTQCAEPWTREKILDKARECVCGDREQDYGSPEDSFSLIAELWSSYLCASCIGGTFDLCINPENVAAMMALLKVARLAATPSHMDSWVDLAGYAACGGEIASEKAKE